MYAVKDQKDTTARGRVLVVDDDPGVSRLLVRVARSMGFDSQSIDVATNLPRVVAEIRPDVIVLDLNMPEFDGIEAMRLLANENRGLSVILVSGVDKRLIESTARLGRSLGLNVTDAISKPIDLERIREALGRQTRARHSVDENEREPQIGRDVLESALDGGRLYARYQPLLELGTLDVSGVETLARLRHPELGEILPSRFIPLAEETGLIARLTHQLLDRALRDLGPWLSRNRARLAINLSPVILDDLDLPDRVSEILARHGVEPDCMVFEITETGTASRGVVSMDILGRFRLKGMHLSIDDYGTGSSTLTELHRLPYEELKIDRSFVSEIFRNKEAEVIVRSTVSLARELGLRVVAEGIEDRRTLHWLREIGCSTGQGFFLSPPLEAMDFLHWAGAYSKAVESR